MEIESVMIGMRTEMETLTTIQMMHFRMTSMNGMILMVILLEIMQTLMMTGMESMIQPMISH